ncbi:MAG: TolC family protein [Flavobacteriales bacterium]|nr:TolC family protein [Flavobacteriales bacterium]
MRSKTIHHLAKLGLLALTGLTACVPALEVREARRALPATFDDPADTTIAARSDWRQFFQDEGLALLIDSALLNNQEFNILMQEVAMARNEVKARKGEYLPYVDITAGGGVDKVGRYTRSGAVESNLEIAPEREFPEPLGDLQLGLRMSWELDVWKKLRNAKKSAVLEYLGSVEGQRFMRTRLIAEVAESYYELLALDNELDVIQANLDILGNALRIVKLQKSAGKVTELAVRRFEAEVLRNRASQFRVRQARVEAENRLNFLLGRFPGDVPRDATTFLQQDLDTLFVGVPAQLLDERPDVRQAELRLEQAKVDVKVAKAAFYPSLRIDAGIGLQAFESGYLFTTPQSLVYSAVGELVSPFINRNALKANYLTANARQLQAVFGFERTVLNAVMEVRNQLAMISNRQASYTLQQQQVDALTNAVTISNSLFSSARADYMEVLLTQRDALEARLELIENKKELLIAKVRLYQALGGGWK